MDAIFSAIEEYLAEMLKNGITSNLSNLFSDVNTKVGQIGTEVGKTPSSWNSDIYSLIKGLSDNAILPIAGIILTYVMVYELISMINEKNHGNDLDFFEFFKYFIKMWIAVYLLSNTFTFVSAIFDVAQNAIGKATTSINSNTSIDATATISAISSSMENMEVPELIQLLIETWIVSFGMKALSICITVILYARMIEIYCYCSVAPIPFSTMVNREWGSIGNNYLKGLFALGFQGFFMVICVGIYAVLVNSMTVSSDIHTALFSIMAYTILLCISLFHTGSLSKAVFNAH